MQDDNPKKKKHVNSGLPMVGLGVYHSGIEIYGREVSFGHSDGDTTVSRRTCVPVRVYLRICTCVCVCSVRVHVRGC